MMRKFLSGVLIVLMLLGITAAIVNFTSGEVEAGARYGTSVFILNPATFELKWDCVSLARNCVIVWPD